MMRGWKLSGYAPHAMRTRSALNSPDDEGMETSEKVEGDGNGIGALNSPDDEGMETLFSSTASR